MKVYIVTETTGMTVEGDTDVLGVWSTLEAAEQQRERLHGEHWTRDQTVLEFDVDSEAESSWGP